MPNKYARQFIGFILGAIIFVVIIASAGAWFSARVYIQFDAMSHLGVWRGLNAHILPGMRSYFWGNKYMTFARRLDALADTAPIAFPTAKGWGATALSQCDMSNIRLYKVTNTLEGPSVGSFDAAADSVMAHPDNSLKVIEFRVAGRANANYHNGAFRCVYIAGQTAPGDGFHIVAFGTWLRARQNSSDFVIRHISSLNTCCDIPTSDIQTAFVEDGRRILIDQNNFYWSLAKGFGITPTNASDSLYNVSFTRNLVAEPRLPVTILGVMMTEPTVDSGRTTVLGHVSYGRNVTYAVGWRLVMINSCGHDNCYKNIRADTMREFRLVGNLFANNTKQGGIEIFGGRVDVLDTRYIAGPYTDSRFDYLITCCTENSPSDSMLSIHVERVMGAHSGSESNSGDVLWYGFTTNDSAAEVTCYYNECLGGGGGDPRTLVAGLHPDSIKRDVAISDTSPYALPRILPSLILDSLVGNGSAAQVHTGDNWRLACNGSKVMRLDSVAAAIFDSVAVGGGRPSWPDTAYVKAHIGFTIDPGTPCADADDDGMFDSFESNYGVTDPTSDPDGDGYPNIVEMLNATSPNVYNAPETGAPSNMATYETTIPRFVGFFTTQPDTLFIADTFVVRLHMPPHDLIPLSMHMHFWVRPSDSAKAMVVWCDTTTALQSYVADSIAINDSLTLWGIPLLTARDSVAAGCE